MTENQTTTKPWPIYADIAPAILGIFGTITFLYGIHPGAEIMMSTATALMTWREIKRG